MKITRVHKSNGRYYYIQDLEERNPRTGRPKQKWHKLTRIDEGEQALLMALGELLGETAKGLGNMRQLVREFKAHYAKTLTLQVCKEYDRMFDVIAEAFADFNAADVEPGDIIKFLTDEFADKPTTRHHYKARLSTFFSWCVLNSHTGVKVNPCREVKLKAPPKRKGRMNAEIYWKLHAALTPMGQCFLELCFLTWQRPTEIRLLRESAIGQERIHFKPTKTEDSSGEEVDIIITPEIRKVLERARELRPTQKVTVLDRRRDPYIIQARDGDHYSKNGFYEVWRDACIEANVKGVTTRDIRPYALATLERMGYAVREIQKAAAHTNMATTEGYLDQHRDRLSSAVLTLPERQ